MTTTGYPPAALNDGQTAVSGPGWVGRTDQGAALTYTFAQSRRVDRVVLNAASNYLPAAYSVQAQTASGWQTVASGGASDFAVAADGQSVVATKTFTPVQASAVKVLFTAAQSPPFVWISEAQVWNTVEPDVAAQRFDAFGNIAAQTAAFPTFGYTGREPDASGLIYYRARYYDPASGRFLSRDPIGLAGGINRYAYVGNNPVNFNDPSGLSPVGASGGNNSVYPSGSSSTSGPIMLADNSGMCDYGKSCIGGVDVPNGQKFRNSIDPPVDPLETAGYVGTAASSFAGLIGSAARGGGTGVINIAAIPGRVQSRINLANEGMAHVINRHLSGNVNASQFSIAETELRGVLQSSSVVSSPIVKTVKSTAETLYVREFNAGRVIGTDKFNGNQATSVMTIMTDRFGNLVTTFPGLLK